MSCSNCFNGCAEITSDKCVKYTGADIPALGISYGDTLLHVEEQLAKFIISTLDGTGIIIDVPQSVICDLIKKHLPTCPSYQLDELIITLIKAICDLQTQVTAIKADITALNADYTIGCLTGVTASSDTHQIVQAIITKLCAVDTSLTALILNVNNNYVKIADINTYIAAYLATQAPANKAYTKMVPYVAMPYFGQLSNYPATGDALSLTGAGIGYWEKVYLCNGLNFTPDLRGRSTVGTTDGTMGGPTMDTNVIPSNPFNPSYSLGTKQGTNSISLTTAQIPAHNHSAANSATGITALLSGTSAQSTAPNGFPTYPVFNSTVGVGGVPFTNPSGLSVNLTDPTHTHTISDTGGGQPHSNNQPMMGAYYIIYIP